MGAMYVACCRSAPFNGLDDDANRLPLAADNVDYNELKNLIKVNTTRDQGQAIAIPGQEDTSLAKFEEQFFNELQNQHDRVDLFVKSKADEISRRLRL